MCTQARLTVFCLALVAANAFARPVAFPSLQEMWEGADLVAVIRPLSTTNAQDQLTSAGPKYGPRNPKDYQALNTLCEVLLVMKTSARPEGGATNTLTLLHFRYAPNVREFNGAMFIYFEPAPPERKGWPGDRTYLAFLRRGPGDRFVPLTGQYDSEPSFRVMDTPLGGASRYAQEEGRRSEPREANEAVQRPEASRSGQSTNQVPGAAGSRR